MKTMNTRFILIVLQFIVFFSVITSYSQIEKFGHLELSKNFFKSDIKNTITDFNPDSSLDSFINETMSTYNIPGVSTYIIRDNQIIWNRSYGYANIEQNKKVTDSTIFRLASISKTFTATALMQLWEDGLFELDDDINDYLPPELQVVNPEYPDDIITFHQLLTHTSSIDDGDPVGLFNLLTTFGSDSPIPLDSYLVNYFMPGGSYYSYGPPFNSWAPGTKYEYSSTGISLVGYLVELMADTSFEDYCKQNIFTPLGMNKTSWFLSGLDTNKIAMQYLYAGGEYIPYGHWGSAGYPCTQLRTSSAQLARFMTAYMQMGELEGVRILDSTTVDLMTTVHYCNPYPGYEVDMGLVWRVSNFPFVIPYFYNYPEGGLFYGHSGSTYGCETNMGCYQTPDEDMGVIVLTNGNYDNPWLIWSELWKYVILYNKIYAYTVSLNSAYIQSGTDTIKITAKFFNPDNHNFTANAIYTSIDSAVIDSIRLFDDGIHFDGNAQDGIWGNCSSPISQEDNFFLSISTLDLDKADYLVLNNLAYFTTIGPLTVENYTFTTHDPEPNPGDRMRLELTLRNNSSIATAKDIKARLISLDTLVSISDLSIPFGDIAAGENSISKMYILNISEECKGNTEVPIVVNISSYDNICWSDTFYILVQEPLNIEDIREPITRIYPNPTNDVLNIEISNADNQKLEIEIFTATGTVIYQKESINNNAHFVEQLDLSGYTNGIYLVKVKQANSVYVGKVVVR